MFELSYPPFPLEVGDWIADGEDTFGHTWDAGSRRNEENGTVGVSTL